MDNMVVGVQLTFAAPVLRSYSFSPKVYDRYATTKTLTPENIIQNH